MIETDPAADGPESPVVQHYEALDRNDFEAANDAIHSESSRAPLADDVIDRAQTRTYEIDSIEVSDADTPTPVVAVEVTETDSETGDTQSLALRIEVKKDGEVWKMHRIL